MALKRTQLYLSQEQWTAVEQEARACGVSAAEVIRRAQAAVCPPKPPFAKVVAEVAGAWGDFSGTGVEYVERSRAEWEERRRD